MDIPIIKRCEVLGCMVFLKNFEEGWNISLMYFEGSL